MAECIDVDFANRSASRVERFKIVNTNPFKANFRCPFCMDSKKSKTKTRGWLLERDNKLHYYCHNCFASMGFINYLKSLDTSLYKDYISEKFMSGNVDENKLVFNYRPKGVVTSSGKSSITFQRKIENDEPEIEKIKDERLQNLKRIDQLPEDHPARQYIASRFMPEESYRKLYYTPKFKKWVNSVLPDKFNENALKMDEPRVVLPFCDIDGKMFGFTGRSFDPKNDLRYMTIMLDPTKDKFFGLDDVDFKHTYYVLEGGIDSLFIDNACAMAGADAKIEKLKNKENGVIVYDNEPRNTNIHKKMDDALSEGFSIVIWPEYIKEKDVNNMILYENFTKEEIMDILKSNTHKGMIGKMELAKWKKIEDEEAKKGNKKFTKWEL